MNKCYLIGEVITEPNFDFIYMSNHISICHFTLEMEYNNRIIVFAYDELADYIYQKISVNNLVCIEGLLSNINKKLSVQINNIEMIKVE